jgi:hypothetical protein
MQVTCFAMKIPGVFVIVLFGAATAASAQPTPQDNTGRVSYRDSAKHKTATVEDGGWVQLASPTPASHGTEFVVVGKELGQFSQLRVSPADGKVIVRRVKIYFDSGKQKIVDVDKSIDAHRKNAAIIDLDHAQTIDRIVITTEPQTRGSYAIYGTAGEGGVARK